jgi:hypothetical protein
MTPFEVGCGGYVGREGRSRGRQQPLAAYLVRELIAREVSPRHRTTDLGVRHFIRRSTRDQRKDSTITTGRNELCGELPEGANCTMLLVHAAEPGLADSYSLVGRNRSVRSTLQRQRSRVID